jgi:hypothetical protein
MMVEDWEQDVLFLVPQDGPIDLVEAAFNVATASIDEEVIMDRINKAILKIAKSTILASIFSQTCPNFTNKPQAAVESLWQSFTYAEGNHHHYTIAIFSSMFMAALRPMVDYTVYPIDTVNLYINRLDDDIINVLKELYPRHSEPHDRAGCIQCQQLAEVIRLSDIAETRVNNMKSIVSHHMGQAFTAPVLPSQAETTLNRYSAPKSPGSPGKRPAQERPLAEDQECFGCGKKGDHPFSKCPLKDDPQAIARAKVQSYP